MRAWGGPTMEMSWSCGRGEGLRRRWPLQNGGGATQVRERRKGEGKERQGMATAYGSLEHVGDTTTGMKQGSDESGRLATRAAEEAMARGQTATWMSRG